MTYEIIIDDNRSLVMSDVDIVHFEDGWVKVYSPYSLIAAYSVNGIQGIRRIDDDI